MPAIAASAFCLLVTVLLILSISAITSRQLSCAMYDSSRRSVVKDSDFNTYSVCSPRLDLTAFFAGYGLPTSISLSSPHVWTRPPLFRRQRDQARVPGSAGAADAEHCAELE